MVNAVSMGMIEELTDELNARTHMSTLRFRGPACRHISEQPSRTCQLPMQSRRDFVASMLTIGGAAALGMPTRSAHAEAASAHADDWRWLIGNWDVWHRRLKERLAGSTEWEEFGGKSALWLTMGGFGTIDDNIVDIPSGTYRGLTLRAFDPKTNRWAIWWLDGRKPTRIDPPVFGGFEGDTGTFFGRDTFNGRPIKVRFRWNDVHGQRPWWEQAFSTDEGATWEVNWRNYFTRTAAEPTPLPKSADAPNDWDFLVGNWTVHHRRRRKRLVGNNEWDEFGGTLTNWPVLGGYGNVSDNVMNFPSGVVRGVGLRAYDPVAKQYSSWWIDSRNPSALGAPFRGSIADGVGTFIGEDDLNGRSIKTRVQWSEMTPRSARWEQSSSADGGKTWETNWISTFTRK